MQLFVTHELWFHVKETPEAPHQPVISQTLTLLAALISFTLAVQRKKPRGVIDALT